MGGRLAHPGRLCDLWAGGRGKAAVRVANEVGLGRGVGAGDILAGQGGPMRHALAGDLAAQN